jgi:glutamine amidotransferase
MITIVDYCAGNLKSVKRALDFIGAKNVITDDPKIVEKSDAIVVPGVGAAGSAMCNLRKSGLAEALQNWCAADKPFLGICLGLQILFEKSEEDGSECLGIFEGEVQKLPTPGVKIPHIGWNPVDYPKTPKILTDIPSGTPFYFVHSYVAMPKDKAIIKATTTHGVSFPSVINRGKVWAMQFHPEKSGEVGLQVLKNFIKATSC